MVVDNDWRLKLYNKERCENCRESRNKSHHIAKEEMLYSNNYSPFQLGISINDIDEENPKIPLTVLLLLQGHNGADWRNDKDIPTTINNTAQYYYKMKPVTFHQNEMQKLLKELTNNNINWYLTDIIKCYVCKNPAENMDDAFETCKTYLITQIEKLKPQVIVTFGRYVKNKMKNIRNSNPKLLREIKFISFPFPSQRAADTWVKNGGIENLVIQIKKDLFDILNIKLNND